jgi:cardiolipin synthase A/B
MKFDILNLVHLEGIWALVAYLVVFVFISFPLLIILLDNRSPVKTISWILVLVLLPFLGILLYIYFGRNYRKKKIFTKKELIDAASFQKATTRYELDIDKINQYVSQRVCAKMNLMKLLYNNSKASLTINNQLRVMNNGQDTFEKIIEAIQNAHHHIHLEYYIIEDDGIGNRIKDLLIEKVKEGVQVRLIYDDLGSWSLSKKYLSDLQQAGVELYSFMPVRSYRFSNKINYRNHRKILVVDSAIGFVGGVNIADRYLKGKKNSGFWRDTHLMIQGDAVLSLQAIFAMDWYFMSGQLLNDDRYFSMYPVEGNVLMQIAASGPDSDWSSIMQTFFAAIATATDYVYISTPYFLPNESIMVALRTAALSGVDVKLMLPDQNDSYFTNWGSRSYLEDLLEAGIRVYFYTKGFTHSKLMMVDDVFCTVGTSNMDIRSFDQNFEVNALIYDIDTTKILKEAFFEDLSHSYQLTLEEHLKRPPYDKLRESVARLFSPVL